MGDCKSFFILVVCTSILLCCQDRYVQTELNDSTGDVMSEDENPWCIDLQEWRKEYLPVDSMKVYGGNDGFRFNGEALDFIKYKTLEVHFPRLILSSKTSITEVSSVYPNSAKLNRRSGYAWAGVVKIFSHKGEADRNFWLLEFRQEVLAKMTFYEFGT